MKLGANSVLFGAFPLESAFKYLAIAGYDGIELAALPDKADHLDLARWKEQVPEIRRLSSEYGLELLAIEQSARDISRMEQAFQAATELGIPVVAGGPGGKSDDPVEWGKMIDALGEITRSAQRYGVTLCVKAHVNASVYNTPTLLRAMEEIASPALGANLDPSHIHRAGENPTEAVKALLPYIRHVHIRDCKGRQSGPGAPADQTNGRGDIDLLGYVRALHEGGYRGALDLEVIGTKENGYSLEQCITIAAETRGHLQASLQACGAR